MMNLTRNRI